eukprot:TRINITY_DN61668_c0_g1_i1.p1 TRINITY_DN61668_c0_g1~~TRINITY_DN61668_c0_g1_i1.p1  ORF type:complete len:1044 (+),score=220.38 TRINITY_DN61668_c0_g1_i1:203-3334(+)
MPRSTRRPSELAELETPAGDGRGTAQATPTPKRPERKSPSSVFFSKHFSPSGATQTFDGGGALDSATSTALASLNALAGNKDSYHRRRRRHGHDANVLGEIPAEDIPAAAYGSVCPVQHLCGIDSRMLPCAESAVAQSMCGNPTDYATRRKQDADESAAVGAGGFGGGDGSSAEVGGVAAVMAAGSSTAIVATSSMATGLAGSLVGSLGSARGAGIRLGYKDLTEAGYELSSEPRSLKGDAVTPEQRLHFIATLQLLGITCVYRSGEPDERFMATFRKSAVPASEKEVSQLIKKLEAIDHTSVAQLVEVCESVDELFFIYEGTPAPGHLAMLALSSQEPLDSNQGARLLQQLAAAISFVSRHGVNHLNLSLWDVMSVSWDSPLPVKLWGVGLAGVMYSGKDEATKDRLCKGAFYYRSPELSRIWLDPEIPAPFKKLDRMLHTPTDVYGIGAIVFSSLAGHTPYGGVSETAVLQRVVETFVVFDHGFVHVETQGIELLEAIMDRNPKQRPKLEGILNNSWISMHIRAMEDQSMILGILERLRAFTKMSSVMQTIGKVISNNMRAEKMRGLEDVFNALDTKGDGHVDVHELTAFLPADHREDIKQIMGALDTDKDNRLSLPEFIAATVFSDDVLTERVLTRTFNALDTDGTGEITPLELYAVLKKQNRVITPQDVAGFMGDVDRDWDLDIDFGEFRGFFPQVKSRQEELQKRIENSRNVLQILQTGFSAFCEDTRQWAMLVSEEMGKLNKLKEEAWASEVVATRDWCNTIVVNMKKVHTLFKNTPEPPLAAKDLETYRTCSFFGTLEKQAIHKKQLDQEPQGGRASVAHSAGAKRLAADADGKVEFEASGPLAFDKYFKVNKNSWQKNLSGFTSVAKEMESEDSRLRRRAEVSYVLNQMEELVTGTQKKWKLLREEQSLLLESMIFEESLPAVKFSKRSLTTVDVQDHAAQSAIEAYQADRKRLADEGRAIKEEQEQLEKALGKVAAQGVKRGLVWKMKRQQATKKGVHGVGGKGTVGHGAEECAHMFTDGFHDMFSKCRSPSAG